MKSPAPAARPSCFGITTRALARLPNRGESALSARPASWCSCRLDDGLAQTKRICRRHMIGQVEGIDALRPIRIFSPAEQEAHAQRPASAGEPPNQKPPNRVKARCFAMMSLRRTGAPVQQRLVGEADPCDVVGQRRPRPTSLLGSGPLSQSNVVPRSTDPSGLPSQNDDFVATRIRSDKVGLALVKRSSRS